MSSFRNRMLNAIGIDEMAIKKTKWEWGADGKPTAQEVDLTAREFAKHVILDALEVTGYWHEKFKEEAEQMTPKEEKAVQKYIDQFNHKIWSWLKPKKL